MHIRAWHIIYSTSFAAIITIKIGIFESYVQEK